MSNNKILFAIFCIFVLLGAGFFSFFLLTKTPTAKAGSGQNVSGFAWSSNIGWMSMNSLNCDANNDGQSDGSPPACPPAGTAIANYGVNISDNGTTGIFSGYAWSNNAGWIDFYPTDLVNCPTAPSCQRATVDKATGEVSGWVKFLTTGDWLRLKGSNYGVLISKTTGEFSGWAWGGETVGWVSSNCIQTETGNLCPSANYKVQTSFSLNTPPQANNLAVSGSNFCTSPSYGFSWVFQDLDAGDTQSAYQLQADKEGNFLAFGPGEVNLAAPSSANNITVLLARNPNINQLDYNSTPYYWRVKVWDSGGVGSAWSNGTSFTTPLHVYPSPDFTFKPQAPSKDQAVQFCAIKQGAICPVEVSTCYGAGYPSCSGESFLWTLPPNAEFANSTNAATPNPVIKFKDVGNQNVSLQITDNAGSCSITKLIKATLPLPKWKEVAPQ